MYWDTKLFLMSVMFILISIAILGTYELAQEREAIKTQAVKLGYAEHNTKTGDWQWIIHTNK